MTKSAGTRRGFGELPRMGMMMVEGGRGEGTVCAPETVVGFIPNILNV